MGYKRNLKATRAIYLQVLYIKILFFFFSLFRAYGGSQARGPIGVAAADLYHSQSNTRFKPHLRPTPQLTATPDP